MKDSFSQVKEDKKKVPLSFNNRDFDIDTRYVYICICICVGADSRNRERSTAKNESSRHASRTAQANLIWPTMRPSPSRSLKDQLGPRRRSRRRHDRPDCNARRTSSDPPPPPTQFLSSLKHCGLFYSSWNWRLILCFKWPIMRPISSRDYGSMIALGGRIWCLSCACLFEGYEKAISVHESPMYWYIYYQQLYLIPWK